MQINLVTILTDVEWTAFTDFDKQAFAGVAGKGFTGSFRPEHESLTEWVGDKDNCFFVMDVNEETVVIQIFDGTEAYQTWTLPQNAIDL